MWEIYSIGDAAYLEMILNAVAMITGTGDFQVAIKIAFLLGVMVVLFQAIAQGGRGINFGALLIGWILFSLLYGSTARVNITDVYSGQVRSVANVPYGVAAVGSIISQVGYQLTRIFETAFSTPAMTSTGFATSIQTLAKVRQSVVDPISLGRANSPNENDDIFRSWQNYIKDCTLVGVDVNQKSLDSIYRTADPFEAVRFDSDLYGTQIFVNGTTTQPTCTQAWQTLRDVTTGTQFVPVLVEVLTAKLNDRNMPNPMQADAAIASALTSLNQGAVSAQDYMLAAVLLPALEDAVVGKHLSEQAFTHAVMARDATEKRNTQWATEQSLFGTIVRPMMTFFEGFVYAVTPIMGFLIGLGQVGVMVAARYILTLLWIQLWMPCLAIINLYISMVATNKMAALASAQQMPLPSFGGLYELDLMLANWISTGGMLAASVPAISLMLVYGASSVTAAHLARRLEGRDHIDEGIATPQTVTAGPVVASAAMYSRDMVGGMRYTGQEAVTPTMSISDNRTQALSTAFGDTATAENIFRHSKDIGRQVQASSSRADSLVNEAIRGVDGSAQWAQNERDELAGILSGNFGMRAGGAVGGGLQAQLQSTYGTAKAASIMQAISNVEKTRGGRSIEAQYKEAVTDDFKAGTTNAWSNAMSEENRKAIAASTSTGMRSDVSLVQLSNQLAGNAALSKQLEEASRTHGVEGAAQDWARARVWAFGGDTRRAVAAGRLVALDNAAASGNNKANAAVLTVVAGALGHGTSHNADMPDQKAATLTGDRVQAQGDNIEGLVNGVMTDPSFAPDTHHADARAQVDGTRTAALSERGQQQEKTLLGNLARQLGTDSLVTGESSYARTATEVAAGTLKAADDLTRYALQHGGQTFFAGVRGAATGWQKGLEAVQNENTRRAASGDKPLSTFESAKMVARHMEGTSQQEALQVYEGLRQAAVGYARESLGLTPAQAQYYAYQQTNTLGRLMNLGAEQLGLHTPTDEALRKAILEEEKGNTQNADFVARAIAGTARSGNQQYLETVREINRVREFSGKQP